MLRMCVPQLGASADVGDSLVSSQNDRHGTSARLPHQALALLMTSLPSLNPGCCLPPTPDATSPTA